MQIEIRDWTPVGFTFGETKSSICSKFGNPSSISNYDDHRVGLFYETMNFNFDDGEHLSSIGFASNSDLCINGVNPFVEKDIFIKMLDGYSKVDRFGQVIFKSLGLILENFDSPDDDAILSLSSMEEMKKYLPDLY